MAALLTVLPAAAAAQGAVETTAVEAMTRRADLARIEGSADAAVWLVVISDFQCPFCKRWHDETAPRIHQAYVRTGKVRIAYLNYPASSHRNALPAHETAMCAAEQDRFWPVADAIFRTMNAWKSRLDARAYFDSLTATLPLDHARQARCVEQGLMRPLIQADYNRAVRAGVGSTPTFFVGSRVIIGAQPYEVFAQALDAAIAASREPRR